MCDPTLEYYDVNISSQDLLVNLNGVTSSVRLFITVNLKVSMIPNVLIIYFKTCQLPGVIPCPNQRLQFKTFPQSNISNIITHPDYVIVNSGDIVYSITAGIMENFHYTTDIRLFGDHGVVQVWRLNFSKLLGNLFDKQQCDLMSYYQIISSLADF